MHSSGTSKITGMVSTFSAADEASAEQITSVDSTGFMTSSGHQSHLLPLHSLPPAHQLTSGVIDE